MSKNSNGLLMKLIGGILALLVGFNAWTGTNIVEMRESLGRVEVRLDGLADDVKELDARRHSG